MNAALLLCLLAPLQAVDATVSATGPGSISIDPEDIDGFVDVDDSPIGLVPPFISISGSGKTWIEITIDGGPDETVYGVDYQLRRSPAPIDSESAWTNATEVPILSSPLGGVLVVKAGGLAPGQTYWFAAKWIYLSSVPAALSNDVSGQTLADTIAPGAYPSFSASPSGDGSITLTWACAQNDGGSASDEGLVDQELRFAPWAIDELNILSATKVALGFAPGTAYTIQQATVSGLEANTTYFFALRGSDSLALTPLALTSATTAGSAAGSDEGSVGTSGCGFRAGGAPAALIVLGLAALLRIRA